MKYEHDNHNTITLHYTEHRTICEANTEQPKQPANEQTANAKSKSKQQQQHTAKLDERMKFKQCCQQQIQIHISIQLCAHNKLLLS